GSLVAPAPVWFHGWIKNGRLVRRRNRPIAPDGRQGQPPEAWTAFSRDAVGIVIFEKVSPCCAPRPHCRTVKCGIHTARRDRGCAQGANGMAFGFTATRPMRLAAALLIMCWVSGARAEEASSPASEQQPAATPSPSPSGQKGGAGRGNAASPPPAAEQHRLPPDS